MLEDYSAQQQPTLTWNTVRGVWERAGMVNLLCEHSELFSETWPTSGMMRDGKVFALPTQAHPTTDSESLSSRTEVFGTVTTATSGRSPEFRKGANPNPVEFAEEIAALMPTLSAAQEPGWTVQPVDKNGEPTDNPNERWYHPATGRLLQKGVTQVLKANDLMPTPTAVDGNTVAQSELDANNPKHRLKVAAQVLARDNLMPTPVASEGTKAPSQQTSAQKAKTGQVWLSNAAKDMEISWGKFEPAIRRWESIIGRPAPAPTKPDGKDGAHRLSSEFTEWMMGVPAGWITDIGLSRNDELKACGNGVVPQQAELALRILLEGLTIPSGGGGR
jgi:hypothetical protein